VKVLLFSIVVCLTAILAGEGNPASAQKKKKGGGGNADKIVGTWELTKIMGVETPPAKGKDPLTFEFSKDGKVKMGPGEGTYKLDGDKLSMTLGGDTKEATIKTLDAGKLVLSQDGVDMELKKK
jgi:hypothetical protein